MILRRLIVFLLPALLLAACGGPAVQNTSVNTSLPPNSAAAQPTSKPAATSKPAPTSAPATNQSAPTSKPAATSKPAPTAQSQPAAPASSGLSGEILFLRGGALIAFDTQTRQERKLADTIRDIAATPDGALLALVRGNGKQSEIWSIRRDGSGLTQLTHNDRAEATPSWAPDGLSLVFASANSDAPYAREWQGWSQWCAASEVHLLDLPTRAETSFGPGCDPAFSLDGLRIAYAARPTKPEAGYPSPAPLFNNSIRLINRKGQNGWDFARASGADAPAPNTGRVLHTPAWSPSSAQLVYHRFLGYQALVDIAMSEIGGSYEGKARPLSSGAGWQLPARFTPTGGMIAITEYNPGDARGLDGYDVWSVTVIRLEGTRQVALPSGSVTAVGQLQAHLTRGQAAVWSPAGDLMAVELPPNWKIDPNQPVGGEGQPGEIWLWKPGDTPSQRLAAKVDFASPLLWLPLAPKVETSTQGYQLVYPADWKLAAPSEFEERTAGAPDGLRLMSAAPSQVSNPDTATASDMFGFFVAPGGTYEKPVTWPDGSVYRAFNATTIQGRPITGATRIARSSSGKTVVALYYTTPERWPIERSMAQALLARSGPTS